MRGEGQILKKLIEKNATEQRSEGGEGLSRAVLWREGFAKKE